ncbi:Uncharacterized protein OBRU01_07008, partial [Operophtera brumata]
MTNIVTNQHEQIDYITETPYNNVNTPSNTREQGTQQLSINLETSVDNNNTQTTLDRLQEVEQAFSDAFEYFKNTHPADRPYIPKQRASKKLAKVVNYLNEITLSTCVNIDTDFETLQTSIYCAAWTAAKINGTKLKLPPEGSQKRTQGDFKPKWQIRLERKVGELRKKIGRLTQYMNGNRSRALTRQINKILEQNKVHSTHEEPNTDLAHFMDTLKQKLTVISSRLRRYKTCTHRKTQNSQFTSNEKRFYQNLSKTTSNIITPVSCINNQNNSNTPDPVELRQFWANIWENPVEYKEDAEWIKREQTHFSDMRPMDYESIPVDVFQNVLRSTHNWKAPGSDHIHTPAEARREWLSGLQGSSGTAVVTARKALLWTDARYFTQFYVQVDTTHWELMRQGTDLSVTQWLVENLPAESVVGIDPTTYTRSAWTPLEGFRNAHIKDGVTVLRALYWLLIAGFPQRAHQRWRRRSARSVLVTNCRVSATHTSKMAWPWCALCTGYYLQGFRNAHIKARWRGRGARSVLSFRNAHIKDGVAVVRALYWLLIAGFPQRAHQRWRRCGARSVLGFRNAHIKDGVAVVRALFWVHQQVDAGVNVTEVQLSNKMRDLRADEIDFMGPSFATIAGAGQNGAIIHYKPSDVGEQTVIRKEDMLLVDSGGQYKDGTTDITRTRHMSSSPTAAQRRAFTRVLKGQINLGTAVFPSGTQGHVIEVLARKALWDVGLNYGHGTGHGVGHYLNAAGMVADFEGRGAVGFYTISLAPHQTACLD